MIKNVLHSFGADFGLGDYYEGIGFILQIIHSNKAFNHPETFLITWRESEEFLTVLLTYMYTSMYINIYIYIYVYIYGDEQGVNFEVALRHA